MAWGKECFPRVRHGYKLPLVLSPEEVSQFFEHVPSLKYRAALMTCWFPVYRLKFASQTYGAGLRISEAVSLKAGDIDSQRMLMVSRLRVGVCFRKHLCGRRAKAERTAGHWSPL